MTGETTPQSRTIEIINAKGLHARASAKFAGVAQQFNAKIEVSRDKLTVSGDSIMGLLLLAAARGCHIKITALGNDAEEALAALADLVANKFDEAE